MWIQVIPIELKDIHYMVISNCKGFHGMDPVILRRALEILELNKKVNHILIFIQLN